MQRRKSVKDKAIEDIAQGIAKRRQNGSGLTIAQAVDYLSEAEAAFENRWDLILREYDGSPRNQEALIERLTSLDVSSQNAESLVRNLFLRNQGSHIPRATQAA
jgi:hypothetical protein